MGLWSELFLDNTDNVQCAICLDVLFDVKSLSCGHHFCSKCIHRWREENNSCPTCRDIGTIEPPNPAVTETINDMQMRCYFADMGCHNVCKYSAHFAHTQVCGFRPLPCERGCNEIVLVRSMAEHLLTCEKAVSQVLKSLVCFQCRHELERNGRPKHCNYYELAQQLEHGGILNQL